MKERIKMRVSQIKRRRARRRKKNPQEEGLRMKKTKKKKMIKFSTNRLILWLLELYFNLSNFTFKNSSL